ncbi:MAG: hypothetical protein JW806_02635 [Sedimentisphaerales bacterium]|nr:hypothetical protein [Sedimentisphaerales bacterium]
MIKYLKPTRLKIIGMVIVLASIWCADILEDVITDPLTRNISPEFHNILEDAKKQLGESNEFRDIVKSVDKQIDESEGNEETIYVKVGIAVILAKIVSKGFVSYLCACVIIGLAERKKSQNKIHDEIASLCSQ